MAYAIAGSHDPRSRVKTIYDIGKGIAINDQKNLMPWYNGDFPPSYKHQPVKLRNKAVEIANELLLNGAEEGIAIATGLKKAREYFAKEKKLKGNTSRTAKK